MRSGASATRLGVRTPGVVGSDLRRRWPLSAFGLRRASADNIVWGVNDDAGKYEQGDGPFWTTLRSVGMTSDTMTLHWDETTPDGFEGEEASLVGPRWRCAAAAGVTVTLDVYPRHSSRAREPASTPPGSRPGSRGLHSSTRRYASSSS